MEIQQSPLFRTYITSLKWQVLSFEDIAIYTNRVPVYGQFAKIQRPKELPYLPTFIPFLKKHHIQTILAEASYGTDQKEFSQWLTSLSKFFRIVKEPFLATKTILIDLTAKEEVIFSRLKESKRRAVRRAEKHGITISASTNIQELIKIKAKAAGMFGSITTYGIDRLWNICTPNHGAILLAHKKNSNTVVGGVLLLFWEGTAYYWIAGATKEGKKLFAPTLLVWEALRFGKKQGAKQFDFVGVWDERTPKLYTSWKGFTKFKEEFGGVPIYYPLISMLHR